MGWRMLMVMLLAAAAEAAPKPPTPAGQEAGDPVTLKGMVLNNVHTGEKGESVFIYALDGPAEDSRKADKTRKHERLGKGNAGYEISEVEYIDSNAGPEKGYPGVIRFRVVVEALPGKEQ